MIRGGGWALIALAACGGADGPGATPDAGGDAGGDDDASAGRVAKFVAQGHVGRTLASCDGGRTWVGDRSDDAAARCFVDGRDCDHDPGAGRGLDSAGGRVVATFGWGQPGGVRTSADGVTWTTALAGTTFGGVVALPDGATLVAAAHAPQRSLDGGATWGPAGDPMLTVWNVRRAAYVPAQGGRVIMFGNDGDVRDLAISADGGATWTHPSWPATCGVGDLQSSGGIVGAGERIVVVAGRTACTSTDGGATFTAADIGGVVESQAVWTGTELVAWGGGQVWRSPDGVAWTSAATAPTDVRPGAVAYGDGVFVAVRGGWQVWYEQQRFYRSTDGVTWETLAPGAAPGGHPIRFITFARDLRADGC